MAADYERIGELLQDFDQTESHHAKWVVLEALRAHAEPMARELLHLYSVVGRFDSWLTVSARNTFTTPATKNAYLDAQYILTELLEGTTE